MTSYERYLGRPMVKEDLKHQREWHVAKLYTKKQMLARWKKIGYTPPKFVQGTLF